MSDPFSRLAARMDAITVRKMGKTASINDVDMTVIPGETLAELNALSGPAVLSCYKMILFINFA
ncbi:hypothetical protein G4F95_28200 [Escherichia coli]|nr:hypothetical protein [Escherichia coli]NYQ85681.1 hypothetical protein [Escherichia coli]